VVSPKSSVQSWNGYRTQWDKDSIGLHSFAAGLDSKAKGIRSFAIGNEANASGDSAIALGTGPIASGLASTAIGFNSFAQGLGSTTLGVLNKSARIFHFRQVTRQKHLRLHPLLLVLILRPLVTDR
jgi:hypothetical protein